MLALRVASVLLALVSFAATLPPAAAVTNGCSLYPLNPTYLSVGGPDADAYYPPGSLVFPPTVSSVSANGAFFCDYTDPGNLAVQFTSSITAPSDVGGSALRSYSCTGTVQWWTGSTYVFVSVLTVTMNVLPPPMLKCTYSLPHGVLVTGRTYLFSSSTSLTYEWHVRGTSSQTYTFNGRIDMISSTWEAQSGSVYVCARAAPGAPCT